MPDSALRVAGADDVVALSAMHGAIARLVAAQGIALDDSVARIASVMPDSCVNHS